MALATFGSERVEQLFLKPEWAIDSEAMSERNNCFSKIQLVGQKYRDKKTELVKARLNFFFAAKNVALFATTGQ